MATLTKPLRELVQELPSHLENEVRDFVEFLLSKEISSKQVAQPSLRQDWAEKITISEYSSVELQHLANTWRDE
jgi:Protein of unknown function (DUF2281)